eukprot:CAMPEP_0173415762 /NCGR_PEP_ID=MMETSP1356-20130122/85033_1 /TAXON_ID=77927 ORGANISM="Hemiselmis virescens, Strain PCC157" /NCGR_SAMPLE_ID=MMETSP1356 /ASSEMBLY_ACC=CAM_ASM_000847 /LENGTH=496 /DNA_ID=CAMNT_0014378035 /DNA_START=226 /DNA_END=1716 /DNA_ORIENTATION=+
MATYDYDLLIIGGGSGGLACSKEAAALGARVAVCDFVTPTPSGTTWGLGGTCVNVGCIPKKLMHQATLVGEYAEDAKSFGWKFPGEGSKTHDWETMVNHIQDHICSLNFGYRTALREKGVKYLNSLARFVDAHTIELTDKKGEKTTCTADKIIIATGGRPKYLGLPNERECCITSDDLFSMEKAPGKTLVVGASYVALECAGFLTGLGYDATIMMRSIPLRGFDQQCAEHIAKYMETHGTSFIRGVIPSAFEKLPSGKVKVSWKATAGDGGELASDEYDTVLIAIGRYALTDECNAAAAGVEVNASSKKVVGKGTGVGGTEQSSVENIFAIGDVLHGYDELTPVAIRAGILLARRLFGGSKKQMDYVNIPTTVFTPVEYGCVGLAEEDAIAKYGADDIEVYHTAFKPLELTVPQRGDNASYAKVICVISQQQKIVGMHILGWNCGEIIQGFGIGLKMGAKFEDLEDLVGIHPTAAETFCTLKITKRSGGDYMSAGC